MKQSFTPEEVNKIENDSFSIGMITGETKERNRVLDLLKEEWERYCSPTPDPEECEICSVFDGIFKLIGGMKK